MQKEKRYMGFVDIEKALDKVLRAVLEMGNEEERNTRSLG